MTATLTSDDLDKDRCPRCGVRLTAAPPLVGVQRSEDVARALLKDLRAFVGVMFGHVPDASIPETVNTPIGIPIKLGQIMREVDAILALPKHTGQPQEGMGAALEKIMGGQFEGASTLVVTGQWHLFATKLQLIAKAALSAAPASPQRAEGATAQREFDPPYGVSRTIQNGHTAVDPVILRCAHCGKPSWVERANLPHPSAQNTQTGTWLRCAKGSIRNLQPLHASPPPPVAESGWQEIRDRIMGRLKAKDAQLVDYMANDCRLDHARAVADGRRGQLALDIMVIESEFAAALPAPPHIADQRPEAK